MQENYAKEKQITQETQRNDASNTQLNATRKKITQAKTEKRNDQHARGLAS